MNRKSKIIVSITGITIVALALLGFTYAYYLTRIEGNTNTNSISVTTAKLELVYGDGNGILLPYGTIEPNSDESIKFYKTDASGNPITNEPPVDNKTFTVTNNGNDSSYVVIIDNVSVTKASDGSATTFVSNDFRYTLSCKKSDNTNCNNVSDLTIFPIKGGILVSNDIEEDDVHTYTLTLWYIDTGIDQSDDMGKSLQARVNITDVAQMENPFKTGISATDNVSLAYNIINNAKQNKNGTRFVNTPPTKVAEEISTDNWDLGVEEKIYYEEGNLVGYAESEDTLWDCYYEGGNCDAVTEYVSCTNDVKGKYVFDETYDYIQFVNDCENGKIVTATVKSEKVLTTTQDDYGISYYYRGNVEDNYVTFADMCWRIVRIIGDGSTKLILEDQDQPCSEDIDGNWGIPAITGGSTYTGNFGYTKYNEYTLTSSGGTKNVLTLYLMDYLHGQTNSESSMPTAFKNFQSTFTESELSKLKSGNWCLGDKGYLGTDIWSYSSTYTLLNKTQIMDNKIEGLSFSYDSYVRLSGYNSEGFQPTLKCNGTIMNDWDDNKTPPTPMYVGGITADEMVYAGIKHKYYNLSNFYNYLLNDNFKNDKLDYHYFWSLSPSGYGSVNDSIFFLRSDGYLGNFTVDFDDEAFRPAVILSSGAVIVSGDGTLENPYVIG